MVSGGAGAEAESSDGTAVTFIEHANAELDVPTVVRVLPYVFKVDQIDPLSMTAFAHIEIALRWRDDRVIEQVTRDVDGDGAKDTFYQIKEGLLEDPEDSEDPGGTGYGSPTSFLTRSYMMTMRKAAP